MLVAVPLLLLGAVSPWAMRLELRVGRGGGRGRRAAVRDLDASARWSACSSSRCGRSRRSARSARSSCSPLVPALVAAPAAAAGAALLVPAALRRRARAPAWARPSPPRTARVLYETETPYQYARVVEERGRHAQLELNEGQAIHSLWRPGTVLTGGYWDGFLVLPFATGSGRPPARIAALGTAGGHGRRARTRTTTRTRGSTPSTSTRSCSRSGTATSGCRPRPQLREFAAGRAAVPARDRASATTRSSSTPTASRTSPST